jgi:hypothetical protein
MRRFVSNLCPGLLLVCCEKPVSSDIHDDEVLSTQQAPRLRHANRAQAPDRAAELSKILEVAVKIESTAARKKAMADVAWNALEIDPKLASEAFQHLPIDSAEKVRLIQYYAMRLAEQNPEEALEWASTLGSDQEIAAAKSQIALTIAETDPRRAANILSESGIAGREFDVAIVQVVQRWAAQSPPDVAAWVAEFPAGAAREAGIRIIAEKWLPLDAKAAFDWLEGMKNVETRRETARAMEGVILQQPQDIRDSWLAHADEKIKRELESQREQAIKDVGDNIPQPQR